jgi:hypothetical protein
MLSVVFLNLRAFAFTAIGFTAIGFTAIGAVALATNARAQPQIDHRGCVTMAMSANGRLVAFSVAGLPANQFILFDTADRRARIIETPGAHVGDFAWSPDGDELTFVTAARPAIVGEDGHVWRLRPTTAGPVVVDLLALIPYVHSPVLSADGRRLAAFEGVIAGDGQPGALNIAYGIFERTLLDGRPTRRSEGHGLLPGSLKYDRDGALFILGLIVPAFPQAQRHDGRVLYHWYLRDAAGRWDYQWRRDIGHALYFRLAPGETLPAWPSPFPVTGAPRGAHLVGPLDDGRIAMQVKRPPSSPMDLAPYDYVAYAEDGTAEILVRKPVPDGAGRSGADLSANGVLFAQIIHAYGESRDHDRFMVFERGALAFEAPIVTLVAHAQRIVVAPSDTPLTPAMSEPHRFAVDPPP